METSDGLKRASEKKKGMKFSPEVVEQRASKLRGISKPKIKCPHCDVMGVEGLLHRWHFNNCRKKGDK